MEVIMGMILLLQVVILIQIMHGKKQVLQYFKIEREKEHVSDTKETVLEIQSFQNEESEEKEESRKNAMKLVDEVLTEVFS